MLARLSAAARRPPTAPCRLPRWTNSFAQRGAASTATTSSTADDETDGDDKRWDAEANREDDDFVSAPAVTHAAANAEGTAVDAETTGPPMPPPQTAKPPKPPRRAMALPAVSPQAGVQRVVANAKANFDETLELSLGLGIDPRKPNQSLRTLTSLPHGTGKNAVVAVFAQGEQADKARAAGASIVGGEELATEIQGGKINFTRCIATPDMMPIVGRVARILGPRGLMPNPKMGTVTMDVEAAVTKAMEGEVELRADRFGFVNCPIGKRSFDEYKLLDNLRAVMVTVTNEKPKGASGKYLRQAVLSSTMGAGVQLDVGLLDPSSARFMRSGGDEE